MNIALCSSFRNAEPYLNRYYCQVVELHYALQERHDSLFCIWGEGDSTDGTHKRLEAFVVDFNARIVDCTHGGPAFGPVVDVQRFRQLAYVANRVLANIPADVDVVLWVESDLIWEAETLVALIDQLANVPCVAPMVMEQSTGGFYDTWAFRRDGAQFTKHLPYHEILNPATGALVRMDSIGSCFAMKAALAYHLHLPEDVVVGMCRQIYALGGSAWLASNLTVWHP